MPCPLPIGLPAGITEVAPASFSRLRRHWVIGGIAEHLKAFGDELLGGLERGDRIG